MQRLPFLGELAIGRLVLRANEDDVLRGLLQLGVSDAERIAAEASVEMATGVLDELYRDLFEYMPVVGYREYKARIRTGSDVLFAGRVDAELEVQQTADGQYEVTTYVRVRRLPSTDESGAYRKFTKSVDLRWAMDDNAKSRALLKDTEEEYKRGEKRILTQKEREAVDARMFESIFGDDSQFPNSANVLRELGIGPSAGGGLLNFQKPYTRFSAWVRRFTMENVRRNIPLIRMLEAVILGKVFQEHLDEAIRGFIWMPGGGEGYNSLKRPRGMGK